MTLEQQRALAMAKARQRAAAATPKDVPQETPEQDASFAERALGTIPGRAVLGASGVITGPLQLGANVGDFLAEKIGLPSGGGQQINEWLTELEAKKRRGMKAQGTEGTDIAGLVGTVASGAGMIKGLPKVTGALKNVTQSAGVGAGYGLATPVTDAGDTFAQQKAGQVALGAGLGAAVPPIAALARGGYNVGKAAVSGARDIADLIRKDGVGRIAQRYNRSIVGEKDLPAVVKALESAAEIIPGSRPTAAQAVAHLPEGSPVIAQQNITAATPGGVSAKFGRRAVEQDEARTAAFVELDKVTAPMRESALLAANATGGIKPQLVTNGLNEILKTPGLRASDVISKTVNDIRSKVAVLAKKNGGVIDANDLYMVRKEIGNTIDKFSKETATFDKRLTASLQSKVQKSIDEAIESSGGAGWKDYLSTYSNGAKTIESDILRAETALKPVQRTELQGGINVAEETRTHIPQMLSRPAMLANATMKMLAGKKHGIEPKIDALMADQFLDPKQLAASLKAVPLNQRSALVRALASTKNAGSQAVDQYGLSTLAAALRQQQE